MDRLKKQLNFLLEADKIKKVLRRTLLTDKSRRENDAEHSWHIALMAVLLYEYARPGVDLLRVLKMLLIHDLVEIYAGDTFAFDEAGYMDKKERETAAAERLFSMLPKGQGEELKALWLEFDEMETADAQYAAAMDRLQPFLHNCVTDGHTWVQAGVTKDRVYKRTGIVEKATPKIWGYVEEKIKENIKKGYIKENPPEQ